MKRIKTGGQHVKENPPKSVFEDGPNPLLNYAILSELMSYLQVPDLRHCRLVNSAWRAAATPHLKKSSWLRSRMRFQRIKRSKGIDLWSTRVYLNHLCFNNSSDSNRELTELGLFGIQNFRIDLKPFLSSSSTKEILLKFLEDYGAHFRCVVFKISIDTIEFLGTVLTCLPNLVTLSINFNGALPALNQGSVWHVWPSSTLSRGVPSIKRIGVAITKNECDDEDEDDNELKVRGSIVATNHYNFLKRLLQIAPNLETLNLKDSLRIRMPNWNSDNRRRSYNKQSENLYLRLLKDEGKALCPRLKDLHLSDYLSTWDMKLMLEIDINFRQLLLPDLVSGYRCPTEAIPDVPPFILTLLERHRSSLEVLELRLSSAIYKDKNADPFSLQFPTFPKLRILLVDVNIFSKNEFAIKFHPIDYATQFPALNDLSLFYKSIEYGENPRRFEGRIDFYNQFFPNDGQVCRTLQRLSVEVSHPKIKSSKSMPSAYLQFSRRLDLMFPNVHNHKEVKACRALDLEKFVANETRWVTRSITSDLKSAVWDQADE